MIYSQLMAKVFSDLESDFTNTIAQKIDEARANGTASFSDGEFDLVFAEVDGDVVIEDKKNNEVTTAVTDDKGSTKLECDQTKSASATEPDVNSPRVEGEDGKGVEAPNSTLPDVDSPISVGITDADKAGQGKHFSLNFNGFDSEDDALDFLNQIYTFSNSELVDFVEGANELENLAAKVAAYSELQDAIDLMESVNYIRCYSNMAEYEGHDMTDLLDRCDYYSDIAEQVISDAEMNMSVTDYFSDMDEDEVTEFFSQLDEDVATILYSAIELESESEEIVTFSDVNDAIISNLEMNQDISELFSDMTEDEVTEFFSQLTEPECIVISNALESEDVVTFSDVNEELSNLDTPVDELFSEYSEDDLNEYFGMFSEGELSIINNLFTRAEEGEVVTYSDYLVELEDYQLQQLVFSDEELSDLASNATELKKSGDTLKETPSKELAKKVKVLADDTLETAERAEEAGHNVDEVKKMSAEFSECASKILDSEHEVKVPADGKVVKNVLKEKELVSEVEKTQKGTQSTEKTYSITGMEACLRADKPKLYKTPETHSEEKVFSTGVRSDEVRTSNPCLTSKF